MEIILEKFNSETNWVAGKVGDYTFLAKHYDKGSEFGIENGRTSKLYITEKNGECVANYDRGWDVEPATQELKSMVNKVITFLEELPSRFGD